MSKMINTGYKKGLRNALLVSLKSLKSIATVIILLQNILHSHIQVFLHLCTYLAVARTFKTFSNAD